MITVYSKQNCMQCMFTKKFLDENNIAYKSIDVTQDDEAQIIDAVGDTYVTLVILCQQLGIEIADCVSAAYNEIKDRRGKLVDGTFIKEE